jgi:hypothetical protein
VTALLVFLVIMSKRNDDAASRVHDDVAESIRQRE